MKKLTAAQQRTRKKQKKYMWEYIDLNDDVEKKELEGDKDNDKYPF